MSEELLGKRVKNKLTDLEGVCENKIIWMFGCTQYSGTVLDSEKIKYFIDEAQILEPLETKIEVPENIPLRNQEKFFGKKCRDKVSGFEGICIGRKIGIYAVDQYFLEAEVDENGKINDQVFDEGRLEVIDDTSISDKVVSNRPGGVSISVTKDELAEKILRGNH